MPDELTAGAALAAATIGSFALTPLTITVARRGGFLDRPTGYKGHAAPTPYLGGTAVFLGFCFGAMTITGVLDRFGSLIACAAALWALGTLDDRTPIAPRWRVLAELAAAAVLSATGLGWSLTGSPALDYGLTALWVVGLVNAFNLMDNLDGATSTVAAVSAGCIGFLALLHGDTGLGALALAISGACLGFLPRNLAGPARVFLGDGGSLAVGLLVAGAAMSTAQLTDLGAAALPAAALLVALPVLDTTLVVISRRRRRIPLVTAGRDHLTHRLLPWLGSPQAVAAGLAGTQGVIGVIAIAASEAGSAALVPLACSVAALGAVAIALLDSPGWRQPRPARAPRLRVSDPVARPEPARQSAEVA
jgi:UDP-GlcNAc:undecaprenyl-phosphate/decaprenyl-phosphate GlcNAc-1-phosphate transferase